MEKRNQDLRESIARVFLFYRHVCGLKYFRVCDAVKSKNKSRKMILLIREYLRKRRERASAEGRFIPRTVAEHIGLWGRFRSDPP
jgi:hypothetical protein